MEALHNDAFIQVSRATKQVPLAFGQETSYENGAFSEAKTISAEDLANGSGPHSKDGSFLAKKVPHTLHIAVEMNTRGIWVPIYVDPDMHNIPMDLQLTPLNEVWPCSFIVKYCHSLTTCINSTGCSGPTTLCKLG